MLTTFDGFHLLTKEDKKKAIYKARFQTFKRLKTINLLNSELISILNRFYKKILRNPSLYTKEIEKLNTVLSEKFNPYFSQQVFLAIDLQLGKICSDISKNIFMDNYKKAIQVTMLIRETPEFNQQCFQYCVTSVLRDFHQRSFTEKRLPSNFHEICNHLFKTSQTWETLKSFLKNRLIGPQVYDPKVFSEEEIHENIRRTFDNERIPFSHRWTIRFFNAFVHGKI